MNTIERTKKGELMSNEKPLIDYCATSPRKQADRRRPDLLADTAKMKSTVKWCAVLFAALSAWSIVGWLAMEAFK